LNEECNDVKKNKKRTRSSHSVGERNGSDPIEMSEAKGSVSFPDQELRFQCLWNVRIGERLNRQMTSAIFIV